METRRIGSLTVSAVGLSCNDFGGRLGARRRRWWWARRSTPASRCSTRPTSMARRAATRTWGRRSGHGATRSCWPPSSACPTRPRERVGGLRAHGGRGQPVAARHRPDRPLPARAPPIKARPRLTETLGALSDLVAEGKIREFGCSNSTAAHARGGRTPIARRRRVRERAEPVQHPGPRCADCDGVLAECDRSGTAFLPYFPLAKGLLSGKYRSGEPPRRVPALALIGDQAARDLTSDWPRWPHSNRSPKATDAACSTWPSGGCSSRAPSPRPSPGHRGPTQVGPTWRPVRGDPKTTCWRPSTPRLPRAESPEAARRRARVGVPPRPGREPVGPPALHGGPPEPRGRAGCR